MIHFLKRKSQEAYFQKKNIMAGDAACTKHMPMLDQEEQNIMGEVVIIAENAGTETGKNEEESTRATNMARPRTGVGVKGLSDANINEQRVKERLDNTEGNLEGAPCEATSTDMNDKGRKKNKQVITKEKTRENRIKKVQEIKSQRSNNNNGGKRRYKALALAVKRHQETNEERVMKQNHLLTSISKNLDKIDLFLGRMD